MYKLYTRPGSGGFVVEAALALAGAPFERINVVKGAAPDPEFSRISPLGQVPALVLPDGHAMTESAGMCQLIAERHPEARLAPAADTPARADFLRWLAFLTSVMYPAVLRYYYAQRYTSDPQGAEAVKAAAVAEIDRGFDILDRALEGRDGLAGEHMSVADVYLLMLAHWHPESGKVGTTWPNVERVCARQREVPAIKQLNASHEMW